MIISTFTGTLESPEQDASLYSHQSWENASTICDIDIYMSDLMKHLILSGFSTDGWFLYLFTAITFD